MHSITARGLCSGVFATLVLACLHGLQARCQTPDNSDPVSVANRLTEPIDENARVALKGTPVRWPTRPTIAGRRPRAFRWNEFISCLDEAAPRNRRFIN